MENVSIIKSVNHAARFILEMISLIMIGYWSFQIPKGIILKYGAGIGSVFLIMVIWASFGSPAAPYRLQGLSHLVLEAVIYGLAFFAIFFTANMGWSILFGVIAVINTIFLYME